MILKRVAADALFTPLNELELIVPMLTVWFAELGSILHAVAVMSPVNLICPSAAYAADTNTDDTNKDDTNKEEIIRLVFIFNISHP
ncbi:hypothetical protein XBO1_1300064 [Xenorhabdus bovienii str. oregonense]|uniref:Uncharacterized protein n=1 Tax=Xenorhabdus bovienii str. oregonense TaxID=1398202 RepID=A0A077P0F1_XENBV|nr:hypothetical protein XBO1_1300064 [Xenorhabdus bovienii str. oregonense]